MPSMGASSDSGTATAAWALEQIAHSGTPHLRKLAKFIAAHAKGTGLEAKIRIKRPDALSASDYDPYGNVIALRRGDEANTYVIVHEIVHAVTNMKIPLSLETGINRKGAGYKAALSRALSHPRVSRPMKGVILTYLEASRQFGIDADLFEGNEGQKPIGGNPPKVVLAGHPYGMGNIDEFIAESLTNESFRKMLAQLPSPLSPSASIWRAVWQGLRAIFRLRPMRRSLLDDAEEHGMALIASREVYTSSGRWRKPKSGVVSSRAKAA